MCCLAQLLLLDAPSNHCLGGGRGVQPGKPRRPPPPSVWSLLVSCLLLLQGPKARGGWGVVGTDRLKEGASEGWLAGWLGPQFHPAAQFFQLPTLAEARRMDAAE